MAQDWYLMKSPYNQLSGFEGEAIDDFAQEGFLEALESDIAVDIELCNYDLSECIPMRAIIQNCTQDSKLQALSRHLFLPIGSCKAGMYVKYKNRYWLIVGLVDDNKMYEKGVMVLCNYLLTWINKTGDIVQRWANVTSGSQYNNGEIGMRFYTIRSDQFFVLTSDDEESLLLDTGIRFVIDKRCKIYEKSFDDTILEDTSKPLLTYSFTRSDNVLYDYQDSGHAEFMATQCEQHKEDGYYVIDGKGYWLCKEVKPVDKSPILSCSIECDLDCIYDGLDAGVFMAKFFDENGQEIDIVPQWNINCDFLDDLQVEYLDNCILISVDNDKLINKSFELSLSGAGYESSTIIVPIKAFI